MESLTWRYMHWFYSQLDLIYVNSEQYRKSWIERGIDGKNIKILPRGLDTRLFHPTRRDARFWPKYGAKPGELILLYVGRVSVEKNLDVFAAAHDRARAVGFAGARGHRRRRRLHQDHAEAVLPDACFTGYLSGEALARRRMPRRMFSFFRACPTRSATW